MKNALQARASRYFGEAIPLEIQTFNLLGFTGIATGVAIAFSGLLTGVGAVNILLNLAASALGCFLLWLTQRSGRYHLAYLAVVFLVFLVAFPAMFFSAGGYHSGMPCFYIFAILFTAMMLRGWGRVLAIAAEWGVYTATCLVAYFYPHTVTHFETEWNFVMDVIVGSTAAGGLLLLVVLMVIRINEQHRARLEALNNLRSEFLSNVSHELKTPLTSISGFSQTCDATLAEGVPTAENLERLRTSHRYILSESDRMIHLVQQLLDVSAVEHGGIRLSRGAVDLAELVRQVGTFHFPPLNRGNNTLVTELPEQLPLADADGERVLQVLVNLLANAQRHTVGGTITIAVRLERQMLRISVQDTGEGMEEQRRQQLFERYLRAGVGRAAGMGIGLYLCKQIVEAHGGQIWIRSELGKGTKATFTLPPVKG